MKRAIIIFLVNFLEIRHNLYNIFCLKAFVRSFVNTVPKSSLLLIECLFALKGSKSPYSIISIGI
jgi:hypothetical protein